MIRWAIKTIETEAKKNLPSLHKAPVEVTSMFLVISEVSDFNDCNLYPTGKLLQQGYINHSLPKTNFTTGTKQGLIYRMTAFSGLSNQVLSYTTFYG